jgi:pyridoxamine 5'-phosphate oxidase
MSANPFDLFAAWYAEANAAETADPNAMTLATVDSAGRPSARIVLLKDQDLLGFVFYTNLDSRKARELQENSSAALLFS